MSSFYRTSRCLAFALGLAFTPAAALAGTGTPDQLAAVRQAAQPLFDQAAREFGVPADLLRAYAFTQTHWAVPTHESLSCTNMPQPFGIMGLYDGKEGYFDDQVGRAARLLGTSRDQVQSDLATNIRAAAALLADDAKALGVAIDARLESWAPVVRRTSAIPDDGSGLNHFAHESEVYDLLLTAQRGQKLDGIEIAPRQVNMSAAFTEGDLRLMRAPGVSAARLMAMDESPRPATEAPTVSLSLQGSGGGMSTMSTDYGPAIWNPTTCNYSSRSGTAITHVAIHTMQGSYSGTISWFKNCSAQVSAHYCVRSSDGQITQMVAETDKAWHIGSENPYTVGIEHEGYVNDASWYTTAMYNASALLSRDICASRGIDRTTTYGGTLQSAISSSYHVKGHVHFPNQSHTDPGANWNWATYKNLVVGTTTQDGVITLVDRFDTDAGEFTTSPAYSGSTVGIDAGTSISEWSNWDYRRGGGALRLSLFDNASSSANWAVRNLSNGGSPSGQYNLGKTGYVGFWMKNPLGRSGLTMAITVDDSEGGTEISTAKGVPTSTTGWYYYQWNLADATQWSAWAGTADGDIGGTTVTLDAIWVYAPNGTAQTILYIDDVYKNTDSTPNFRLDGGPNDGSADLAMGQPGDGPSDYRLSPAMPNPFNPTTQIAFRAPAGADVSLRVYDALGHQVRTLMNGQADGGTQIVNFDGSGLPSGLYLVRMSSGAQTFTQRVTLMK